jgi:hypothetical protein
MSSPTVPSPRVAPDEDAVLIGQVHRQTVDLRLGDEAQHLLPRQSEEAADGAGELDEILRPEHIVQAQHRRAVPGFGEAGGGGGAGGRLARAVTALQLGEVRLNGGVAVAQRIIFGVADLRRVVLVVGDVGGSDFGREGGQLLGGFGLGQVLDTTTGGGWLGIEGWHVPDGMSRWQVSAAKACGQNAIPVPMGPEGSEAIPCRVPSRRQR